MEIRCNRISPENEMKDHIESSFGYDQEIEENEYMLDYLFTIPFPTNDNSLQDCSSGKQCLNIKDATGENVVRNKSTILKEFNRETVVCKKDSIFNLVNCQHNKDDCVVDI